VAYVFIRSGLLGKLRALHCRNLVAAPGKPLAEPPQWRLKKELNGGGILCNWGCYDMDFLLGLTGWSARPVSVSACCWGIAPDIMSYVPEGSGAETHYAALIRCEGGLAISMERGEYMSAQNDAGWHIVGERGSLSMPMGPSEDKKIWFDEFSPDGVRRTAIWESDEENIEDPQLIYRGPLEDFVRAINGGRQPMTTLENALLIQRITDKIYESNDLGREVNFL
jgi:predicted dehydrogenase